MTSIVPSKKPQVRPAIDGPRNLTKSSRGGSATLQQDVTLPQTPNDVHSELVAIVKTENVLSEFNTAIRERYDVTEPKSFKEDTPNCLYHFELAAPSISSPTEPASAPSSPGAGSDIWDSPETPPNKTIRESAIEVFTPLTPPTTYEVSVEQTSITKAPGSLLTDNAVISELIPYAGDEEDEQRADSQDEGYFKPKKLIRNLTKELQALSEANAAAATLNYKANPSFEFSPEPPKPARSQRPSKTEKRTRSKVSHTEGLVTTQSTAIKVESIVTHRVRSPQTDLSRLLEHIIPPNIHSRLMSDPHECVASLVNNPDEKCNKRVHRLLNSVDAIFQNISRHTRETDYSALLEQIEQLVQVVMCGVHRNVALVNSKPDTRIAKLRKQISDLSNASRKDRSDLIKWITAISDSTFSPGARDTTDHDGPAVVESAARTARRTLTKPKQSKAGASATVATVLLSYSLKFVPYQLKWSSHLSVSEALHKVITKPLKPTDKKDGFIYIFWDRSHFGMVKIGRTNNLERRLEEWNRQCGRVHSYHNASNRGESAQIPHVSRIERLIHIELKDRRMRRKCEGCSDMHEEWFNVGETDAISVFQKWRNWIVQKPYAFDAHSGEWKIRPEMLHTLDEVCEPVPLKLAKQAPPAPRRQRGGGKKKQRRKPARRTM